MKIFNMTLHETIEEKCWYITRVPSGWIYRIKGSNDMVFVPFDNKFQDETLFPGTEKNPEKII